MSPRFATAEALVAFHIEDQRKDALISRLEGQTEAYKATVDSMKSENQALRKQVSELETQLHDKWIRNEILSALFASIAVSISEAEDALKGSVIS